MTDSEQRCVVLDPEPVWLSALTPILTDSGLDVIAATTRPQLALELISRHEPDLFLVEPAAGGTAVLTEARELAPAMRMIAIAASTDPEMIDQAIAAGVVAYVIKTAEPEDIRGAIRQAFRTSIFLPSPAQRRGTRKSNASAAALLTRRELEILRLAASGRSNADLARMLWVTEQTVKFHLSNVYRKLRVANRTEASRWAHGHGLLDDDAPPPGP